MDKRNNRIISHSISIGLIIMTLVVLYAGCAVNESQEMDALAVIHNRQSVRAYQSTPVPKEHLLQILDAARMAPTAGNQQPWKFLVVEDQQKIDAMKEACIKSGLEHFKKTENPSSEALEERKKKSSGYYKNVFSAPVYIVVLTDSESRYAGYNHHDGPLAAGYLMLAARALGYGTVYYTDSVPVDVTKSILNIPDRYKRVCITPVGIPREWPEKREKKPLDELVIYEILD